MNKNKIKIKIKILPLLEKIFENHLFDSGLTCRIYKELLKSQFNNGQRM
jgi:hypothetical protein